MNVFAAPGRVAKDCMARWAAIWADMMFTLLSDWKDEIWSCSVWDWVVVLADAAVVSDAEEEDGRGIPL